MDINELKHYPRFVLNFGEKGAYSTGDLELFNFMRREHEDYPIENIDTGDILFVKDENGTEVKYEVVKINVRDILKDTNDKVYGVWGDDTLTITGRDKFFLMSIFIYLEPVDE